jgi:hypothetical protein
VAPAGPPCQGRAIGRLARREVPERYRECRWRDSP